MKNIIHIPIDGGPCGGKTEGFMHLEDYLIPKGIMPIIVPESARIYFKKNGREIVDRQKVHNGIFSLQLENESKALEKAFEILKSQADRVAIFYDRSLMTNKAYMSETEWMTLLDNYRMSEKVISQRYTQPIHLVTAAIGAIEHYKIDPERPETPEEAAKIDMDLRLIWQGYFGNPIIHNNSGGFAGKIEELKSQTYKAIKQHFKI